MIDFESKIVLVSFGITELIDASFDLSNASFLAPETQSNEVTVKSDVYSLGICLYFMMTHRTLSYADVLKEKFKFPE